MQPAGESPARTGCATFSERRGNEVFIYLRGVLVMKRWLNTGVSVTLYEAGHPRWSAPR